VRFRVKIGNNLSEQRETSVGLRKGVALSFNLALGEVITDSQIETKGTVLIKVPKFFLTLMIPTDALKETINKLAKSRVMRLTVNRRKTYYIEVTKKPTNTKKLKLYDQEYEWVKEFKYLGTVLTATEIRQRIIMDN
jgi:hypothetical protein